MSILFQSHMKRSEEMKGKKRKTEVGGQEAGEWESTEKLDQFSFTETKAREREGVPYASGFSFLFVALIKYSF